MSSSNCYFLTYIQISQQASQVVWYSHLLKSFPQFVVIYTVKGFGIVNKAEVDDFLELSCFFHDPTMLAIWSLVPLTFLDPTWTTSQSKGLSRVFSNTTVQKHQLFSAQLSLYFNSHIHTWLDTSETHSGILTIQMSLNHAKYLGNKIYSQVRIIFLDWHIFFLVLRQKIFIFYFRGNSHSINLSICYFPQLYWDATDIQHDKFEV